MLLSDIHEVTLYGVYERGVPNAERVVLRANQDIDMGNFGLLLGLKTINRAAQPINNRFFWFGDGIIKAGNWIHVYTADGVAEKTVLKESKEIVYALYWGFQSTILANELLVPVLIRIDAVTVDKVIFPQIEEKRSA